MQKVRRHVETSPLSFYNAKPERRHPRYPVPLPEVVSYDVIGNMVDEDLHVRLRAMEDDSRAVFEAGLDPRPWEEEIAYVKREQQIRRDRRERHARFVRDENFLFEKAEMNAPEGDFDNSPFVYAATGGRPKWN